MNYAWDIALKGMEQEIPLNELSFIPANPAIPYAEIAFNDINQSILTDHKIEVNGMYRYTAIFEPLLDGRLDNNLELRDTLYDVLTHFLIGLDLRQGLCKEEFYQIFAKEDLHNGKYGEEYRDILSCFPRKQWKAISIGLVRLYKTGPSLLLFKTVMKEIYPHSIIYFRTDKKRELLIYIGYKETSQRKRQIEFLCEVFVPLDYKLRLFWEYHFGIVGISETMVPDEIMVF